MVMRRIDSTSHGTQTDAIPPSTTGNPTILSSRSTGVDNTPVLVFPSFPKIDDHSPEDENPEIPAAVSSDSATSSTFGDEEYDMMSEFGETASQCETTSDDDEELEVVAVEERRSPRQDHTFPQETIRSADQFHGTGKRANDLLEASLEDIVKKSALLQNSEVHPETASSTANVQAYPLSAQAPTTDRKDAQVESPRSEIASITPQTQSPSGIDPPTASIIELTVRATTKALSDTLSATFLAEIDKIHAGYRERESQLHKEEIKKMEREFADRLRDVKSSLDRQETSLREGAGFLRGPEGSHYHHRDTMANGKNLFEETSRRYGSPARSTGASGPWHNGSRSLGNTFSPSTWNHPISNHFIGSNYPLDIQQTHRAPTTALFELDVGQHPEKAVGDWQSDTMRQPYCPYPIPSFASERELDSWSRSDPPTTQSPYFARDQPNAAQNDPFMLSFDIDRYLGYPADDRSRYQTPSWYCCDDPTCVRLQDSQKSSSTGMTSLRTARRL